MLPEAARFDAAVATAAVALLAATAMAAAAFPASRVLRLNPLAILRDVNLIEGIATRPSNSPHAYGCILNSS